MRARSVPRAHFFCFSLRSSLSSASRPTPQEPHVHIGRNVCFAIVSLTLCTGLTCAQGPQEPWSVRIARSFQAVHPDSIIYADEAKSRKWNYEQGLMLEAFYKTWMHTGDSTYLKYARMNLDFYVTESGEIRTYKLSDFNLDNIAPGKFTVRMFLATRENRYRKAAEMLRGQLRDQPRTKSRGFWHKKIYPFQMWLDGLYMAEPFYALYARTFNEPDVFDDIAHQFLLIRQNNRDPRTGLYYHGWDESRQQRWADSQTGCSPNFWGRSIGWMAMALADVLELFPEDHPKRADLLKMFQELAESAWQARDRSTSLWYQVVDRQKTPGNYLEASASAMLAYAMAKGANNGYLPQEFGARARASFKSITEKFVSIEKRIISLNSVCKVGGLGGRPYRDGSFEYYVGEPIRTNDFKGYGPFLLAAIEIEKLGRKETSP